MARDSSNRPTQMINILGRYPLLTLCSSMMGWRGIRSMTLLMAVLTLGVSADMHMQGNQPSMTAANSLNLSKVMPADGLFEYRKVSAKLILLWREYTAMADALSHALRDYNVAVVQEKRKELTDILAYKYREAEDRVSTIERQGDDASPLAYSEIASLKEIKLQMKAADKLLAKIPDYRLPEENALLIEEGVMPVNVSAALSRGAAKLFYKSVSSYRRHLRKFKRICFKIRSLIQKFKMDEGKLRQEEFMTHAADLGNLFDADGPVSLRMHSSK